MPKLMEVHASQIGDKKTCARLHKYRWREQIVPKVQDRKLWLGTGVHAALEAYYTAVIEPARAFNNWATQELFTLSLTTTPEEMDEFTKQAELGMSMMEGYLPWAKENDNFTVLAVEQEFRVPVLNPKTGRKTGIYHKGKLDMIVEDSYQRLWPVDHKTATNFPSPGLLRLDEQMGYYVLAVHRLFPHREIAGVLYNVLRKQNPKTARTPVFARYPILYNRHQIQRLAERLYHASLDIRSDKLHEPSPSVWGSGHCSWKCSYRSLCIAEEDGSDVELLKQGLFMKKEVSTNATPGS